MIKSIKALSNSSHSFLYSNGGNGVAYFANNILKCRRLWLIKTAGERVTLGLSGGIKLLVFNPF